MFDSIINMPLIRNMPRLKICLGYTWFWIKLSIIDIWQGLEYVSSSEYANVTQGSIENGPSYSSGSQCTRTLIYIGCEYVKVTQGSV